MRKTYPYTFNDWMEGESGPVIQIPVDVPEAAHYQCEYLVKYNFLRDRGWVKDKDGKRWICPRGGTYGTMDRAYGAQRYWEMINEE